MSKVPLELTEQYSNEKQKIKIRLNKNIFIIKIKGTILINNRVVKSKWHTAKYSDPYSESMLYIYPSKCTQTAVNAHTHTVNTPGAVGSHLCCGARGAVGCSVSCSRAPQSWYWRWRELYIHSPHRQFLPDLRLELATFRLWVWLSTIRPRL